MDDVLLACIHLLLLYYYVRCTRTNKNAPLNKKRRLCLICILELVCQRCIYTNKNAPLNNKTAVFCLSLYLHILFLYYLQAISNP
ncbi:unnamed protein product [Coffea canephora]|uniref:DH200=94 genomic scaffold, scaffold_245 n=1 Tax=Coffea canephora TaxID=49390 RepID=A0A068VD39_COFCA|nr:unnamed protein product [Coffea canephora]